MERGLPASAKPRPTAGRLNEFEESLTLPNNRRPARNLVASEPLPLPAAGEGDFRLEAEKVRLILFGSVLQ